jgi:hypothetical protein
LSVNGVIVIGANAGLVTRNSKAVLVGTLSNRRFPSALTEPLMLQPMLETVTLTGLTGWPCALRKQMFKVAELLMGASRFHVVKWLTVPTYVPSAWRFACPSLTQILVLSS